MQQQKEAVGVLVGVDFGTSKLCAAIWDPKEKLLMISNHYENNTTPTIVSFLPGDLGEILVGEPAKGQPILNPSNTVVGVKDILGKKFDDVMPSQYPFKLVEKNEGYRIAIEVEAMGRTRQYAPEEIVAMLLQDIKHSAEQFLR